METDTSMEKSMMSMMMVIMMAGVMTALLQRPAEAAPPVEPEPPAEPEPPPEAVAPEVIKYFLRASPATTSIAYSGWMSISCPYVPPPEGTVWNIAAYGPSFQVGVIIRNNDSVAHTYKPVISNYHWTSEVTNDYVTDLLVMGVGEPAVVPPAPTGRPYSNYEYEPIDKIIPAEGAVLQPGETGFIYTEAYYQSRRFNTVSMLITCDGVEFGPYTIISGWYSY